MCNPVNPKIGGIGVQTFIFKKSLGEIAGIGDLAKSPTFLVII